VTLFHNSECHGIRLFFYSVMGPAYSAGESIGESKDAEYIRRCLVKEKRILSTIFLRRKTNSANGDSLQIFRVILTTPPPIQLYLRRVRFHLLNELNRYS